MKIDKKYYEVNLFIFYADLVISTLGFGLAFLLCLNTTGLAFAFSYLAAAALIYRLAVFVHEITHQQRSGQLKRFEQVWNLTIGAVLLMPAVRFFHPHLTHHQIGVFGTRADPQYMPLRRDRKLALFLLLVVPFIMPLFNLLLVVASSFGVIDIEGAIERYLARKGYTVGSALPESYKRQVTRYGRYYLALFLAYVWFFPETLPLMYAIQVGGWWLGILRIPLEHGMRDIRESSDAHDQVIDSFTIENPLVSLLQPLGLRLHTAHHMYPGVPYHNLPALHAELKQSGEEYRRSIVSFLTAVRGPEPRF